MYKPIDIDNIHFYIDEPLSMFEEENKAIEFDERMREADPRIREELAGTMLYEVVLREGARRVATLQARRILSVCGLQLGAALIALATNGGPTRSLLSSSKTHVSLVDPFSCESDDATHLPWTSSPC